MSAIKKPFFTGRAILSQGEWKVNCFFAKKWSFQTFFAEEKGLFFCPQPVYNGTKEAKAMHADRLREHLNALVDTTVLPYQNAVITDTHYPILGIRMGPLRALARQIAREDWQSLLRPVSFETYEQALVTGLAVAYAPVPFWQKAQALRTLLPHLDSWAMTDSIVPTLKPRREELEQVRRFALACLAAPEEYTVRFGVILLLDYFLTPGETDWTARQLTAIRDERYYVRMAVAWCLAEMAVHAPPAGAGNFAGGKAGCLHPPKNHPENGGVTPHFAPAAATGQTMEGEKAMKRIMGIDYGDARTGVAYSDLLGTLVGSTAVVPSRNREKLMADLVRLTQENEVGQIVVGLPRNMDGSEGPRAALCREFARQLQEETGLPVTMWDERRTTVEAHNILSQHNYHGQKRKNTVDAVAASLILEGYLNSKRVL